MNIFRDKALSAWLENVVSGIDPNEVESICFVALGRQGAMSAYYNSTPNDLFVMSGTLMQDALFKSLEENRQWLRDLIRTDEEEAG